jgi:hypothetical protein
MLYYKRLICRAAVGYFPELYAISENCVETARSADMLPIVSGANY